MRDVAYSYREHPRHGPDRIRLLLTSTFTCARPIFLLLLLAWTATNWTLTVHTLIRNYNPMPIWDYWNVVQHLDRYRAFDLKVLWEQHNEHRIVFPEIVFALDMLLAHGRQVIPLVLSFLCYFSTWLILGWAVLADKRCSHTIRFTAALLAGIVMGWQGSAVALGEPFLLQWTLVQFATALGLLLIATLAQSSRPAYLVAIIACGTVASYSSANGLLFWPLTLAVMIACSVRKPYLWVLSLAAVANVGVYFFGFHFAGGLDLAKLLWHPAYLIGFLSSYVSMPFGAPGSWTVGVRVGLANFTLFSGLLIIAIRTRLFVSSASIVLFGYSAFTLLTALLIAVGRMDPTDLTFSAAKAGRYITMPLANWGALMLLLIWMSTRRQWKLASPKNLGLAAIILLMLTFPELNWWIKGHDTLLAEQEWGTLSIENGLLDEDLTRYVFPNLRFVKIFLPELRDEHLSIFSHGRYWWLGKSLSSKLSPSSAPPRPGAVTRTVPVEGGLAILGWAEGPSPLRIIFLNEHSRVVGFGKKLPVGVPPDLDASTTPRSLAWVGFINTTLPSKLCFAYVEELGRYSPIAAPLIIPRSAVPMENAKRLMTGLR